MQCNVAPEGATAGVDIRGCGPVTRETDLLKSENMIQKNHAVTLSVELLLVWRPVMMSCPI